MEEFKIGDVVKLKSGSPKMTIRELNLEDNNADCVWYEGDQMKHDEFDIRTLKKAPDRSMDKPKLT